MTDPPNNFYIQYFLPYILIVLLVFIIIYWGFNTSINESECLSISLIIGLIYLAINYRNIVKNNVFIYPNTISNIITIVILLITFTTLFVFMTGVALLTFNRSKKLHIFHI